MVDMEPFKCLMLGLPKAGKSTFLAALWYVLKSAEIPGSLVMERREGDQEYLNLIADQWSKCEELDRTPRSGHMGVAIVLKDPIRYVGEYKVPVKLHREVTLELPVHVVKEAD